MQCSARKTNVTPPSGGRRFLFFFIRAMTQYLNTTGRTTKNIFALERPRRSERLRQAGFFFERLERLKASLFRALSLLIPELHHFLFEVVLLKMHTCLYSLNTLKHVKSQLTAHSVNPIRSDKRQKRADCTADWVLCELCSVSGVFLRFFLQLHFWGYYTTVHQVFLCLDSSQERQVCFH